MLTIWARSFLTATRQDRRNTVDWAAPPHWIEKPRRFGRKREARDD